MKQATTNPVVYIIYVILIFAMVYFFFFGGYQSVAYPIPLSVIAFVIFGYTSFYFLRPYYPIKINGDTLTIYINFFYKKPIKLSTITFIEKYNRYDRLVIQVEDKKINISFLLNTDELVKIINKQKSPQI